MSARVADARVPFLFECDMTETRHVAIDTDEVVSHVRRLARQDRFDERDQIGRAHV